MKEDVVVELFKKWKRLGPKRMEALIDHCFKSQREPGAVHYYKLHCSNYILIFRTWGSNVYSFGVSANLKPTQVAAAYDNKIALTMTEKNLLSIADAALTLAALKKIGEI